MPTPLPPAPSHQPHLILASGSPRRRELLQEAGYFFTVIPPNTDVECGVCSESGPAGLVADLAYRKAAAVVRQLRSQSPTTSPQSPAIILAADTVAECDGFILGKPRDEEMARAMLRQLSGRDHRVLTGICLFPLLLPHPPGEGTPLIRVAVTKLRMDHLTDQNLDEYLASGQWEGKAGAFGYQDRLGWVHIVEGSASNVVGLPMELLATMLAEIAAEGRGRGAGSSE
jgi:nucleoside triphosphate pyrophosphatase